MQNIALIGGLDGWAPLPTQLENLGFAVAEVASAQTLSNAISVGRPGTDADLGVPEGTDALRALRIHILQRSAPRVLVFAASTRTASFNKSVATWAAARLQEAGVIVDHVDLRDDVMPLYDGDLEAAKGLPASTVALQRLLFRAHGIFVSSPEYNGYLPPLLKNTLDWLSRSTGDTAGLAGFAEQVVAVSTASPGGMGGVRALPHIRQLFENLGGIAIPGSVAIGGAYEIFADDELADERVERQLRQLIAIQVSTIGRLHRAAVVPAL